MSRVLSGIYRANMLVGWVGPRVITLIYFVTICVIRGKIAIAPKKCFWAPSSRDVSASFSTEKSQVKVPYP